MNLKTKLYRQKEKYKRYLNRRKYGHCTVLLYHRVIDLDYDPQQLCVGVNQFRDQLESLKKKNVFLSIDEFADILQSGKNFPKNSLLVSFDDGYADNYYNAVPVLESLNIPAVFYISTAGIDTNDLMWWDELDLIFKNRSGAKEKELYKNCLVKCKTASSLSERNNLMSEVRTIYNINEAEKNNYKMLSTDELKKMSASKIVTIGGHTINHLSLGHISAEDQKTEIEGSIKKLEALIGKKLKHFSYPYGEKINYNEKTISICRQLGLTSSAANYEGYVSKGTDLFSYPRFVVRNDSPEVLNKKLQSIL